MKTNVIMDRFLAERLNITDRGLRKIKAENPARYQREMIGALILASMSSRDYLDSNTFNSLLSHFDSNTDLQVLDGVARKKIRTLDNLVGFAAKNTEEDPCNSSFTSETADFIKTMVSSYFNGYYGHNDENFEFSFETWHGKDREEKMKYGKILPILTVSTVDVFCGQFDSLRKEEISLCVYTENKDQRLLTLGEIIEKISVLFPEMKKQNIPTYEQNFVLEFASYPSSTFKTEKSLCSVSTELPNGWRLHVDPMPVSPMVESIDEMILPFSYIMVRSDTGEGWLDKYILTPTTDEEEERNIDILYNMCKQVGLENDKNIIKMIEIIEKKRSKEWKEENKDIDDDVMFHVMRLEDYMFDHISKGIALAIADISYRTDFSCPKKNDDCLPLNLPYKTRFPEAKYGLGSSLVRKQKDGQSEE